jgi:hypothetical protein
LSSAALTGEVCSAPSKTRNRILARAFAEQAGGGQGDAFAEAEAACLARDQLPGQVVAAGLGAGRDGVRGEALPARHAGIDALVDHAGAEVLAHFHVATATSTGRVGGQAEAAQAAVRDRTQVIGGVLVRLQHFAAGGVDLFQRVRNRHVVDLGRGVQTLVVVGEAEDHRAVRGLVAADALEHGRAVMHDVRHDVRGGLGPALDRAVVPDPFGVVHGHSGSRWRTKTA